MTYVQFGAGHVGPKDWKNFDASPTLKLERIPLLGRLLNKNASRFGPNIQFGDIVKGLPIPNGTVTGLYASMVLEHLTRADCMTALANSYKMLKDGGVFRLIVPDLYLRAKFYLEGNNRNAHWFINSTLLGRENFNGIKGKLFQVFGHSSHLWMWDEKSMREALESVGFTKIRRCDFGDSGDPMFSQVESYHRFYNEDIRELALEAKK